MSEPAATPSKDFIRQIVERDRGAGLHGGRVQTRFPPEPNGYLHIGHAKSICLNFGIAREYGGECNLRFDDTNPEKEDTEYVEAIREDIRWLGFDWDRERFASDYFETLYGYAVKLIEDGKAFVCELDAEAMRDYRGTATEPGRNSPFRDRPVSENLDLFRRMRDGEFADGSHTLRAKIDMAHPNFNMRDPVLYRIRRAHHHRTGDSWCIYPSYDFAHGQSDSIEEVTHSLCSLEFEDHRPLYNWFIEQLGIFPSRQYEFARLNLTYTVMSKRKLRQLVEEGHVAGWDDPRMPTLCGIRRRGIPPEAIRNFCETIGVTKFNSLTDLALLEHAIRDLLNRTAERRMAVLAPLKVVLTNLEPGHDETIEIPNNPEDEATGSRSRRFGPELWIEAEDFMEDAPKKFFRLSPGREVRLRNAYVIRCDEVVRDDSGRITELRCFCDLATLGQSPEGRKVKGVIHWVDAREAVPLEVRLYDRLFTTEKPEKAEGHFLDHLNPDSVTTIEALGEPALAASPVGVPVQFERVGYFAADPDTSPDKPVFNRVVALKDSWKKS